MTDALVKPELLQWAMDRSGIPVEVLIKRFKNLDRWVSGDTRPTLKQLQAFAKRTMTPFGYLFLEKPPEESLTIPDFRTIRDAAIPRPSPNLLETVQTIERRQAWLRELLIEEGQEELDFVASARGYSDVKSLAIAIREKLGLDSSWAENCPNWEIALSVLRSSLEQIGIFVATSGIVGLNTHRVLDPQEFRGFVLCDSVAPFIFVNGADSKSAQMFTLAHEVVHLWVGRDGLFNLPETIASDDSIEQFCNRTAAEFLLPEDKFREAWNAPGSNSRPFRAIANKFKVSPLVAARRAFDMNLIGNSEFFSFYENEQAEWQARKEMERENRRGGPSFYDVQDLRLGRRFAYAVVRAAREGKLSYIDAFRLTGLQGVTFDKYAKLLLGRVRDE